MPLPPGIALARPKHRGFGATHRVQSLKSPRLQPLARARFRTQRIQETHALQQETVLEVFTEDYGNIVHPGNSPNLRIPITETTLTHSADGFKHYMGSQIVNRPRAGVVVESHPGVFLRERLAQL